MKASDAILCAFEDLGEHKLRSALTMLGIMFGVGAVIAMLSIGAGAERRPAKLGQRAQGERPLSGEEPRIGHGRIKAPGPGEGAR